MANMRRRSMMLMEGHSQLALRIIISAAAGDACQTVMRPTFSACCAARFRSLRRGSTKRGGDDRNERCPTPVSHAKTGIVGERGSTCDVIQWRRGLRNKNSGTALREQEIPTNTKNCAPTSRVLQEVLSQVPSGYVTVGWLTSSLHGRSLGTIILCFGLLAMTPVGSSVPGL